MFSLGSPNPEFIILPREKRIEVLDGARNGGLTSTTMLILTIYLLSRSVEQAEFSECTVDWVTDGELADFNEVDR